MNCDLFIPYHVFPSRHEALVNNFGGIVAAGVDVDAFFDRRVRSCAERLADLVSARLDHRLLLSLLVAGHDLDARKRQCAVRVQTSFGRRQCWAWLGERQTLLGKR